MNYESAELEFSSTDLEAADNVPLNYDAHDVEPPMNVADAPELNLIHSMAKEAPLLPADEVQEIAITLHKLVRHRIAVMHTHGPDGIELASTRSLLDIVAQPCRASDLAEKTYCDPSTITRHVNQLVKHNLVEKRRDFHDGRATLLVATEEGKKQAAWISQTRADYYSLVFKNWSPEDRRDFIQFLRKFIADSESLSKLVLDKTETEGA